MTVSTTHILNSFTGDGSTKIFSFTFQVVDVSEIVVRLDGEVQESGYTVTKNKNQEQSPGGIVTFITAPGNGVDGELERETPITQEIGFNLESKIDTEKLVNALDKMVLLMQEAKYRNQGPQGEQGPQGPQGPGGDMTGPGSSTNNALAVFNGTSGTLLKNGPAATPNGAFLKVVSGQWQASAEGLIDFPSGSIMFWDTNMAAVPAGWEPMDGRTVTINGVSKVTVDTRGKYLLCAAIADVGSTGYTGSTARPGTVAGLKTHQHPQGGFVTTNQTTVIGSVTTSSVPLVPGDGSPSGNYAPAGSYSLSTTPHNHSASITGFTQAIPESSRPIEAALLAIIKVDD